MRADRHIEATWDANRGVTLEGVEEESQESPERVHLRSDDEIAQWLGVTPVEAAKISEDLIERATRDPSSDERVTSTDTPHDGRQEDEETLQEVRWAEYQAEEVTSDAAATTSVTDDAQAATARSLASDAQSGVARGASPTAIRATSTQARTAGEVAQNEADEQHRLELAAGDPSTRRGLNAVASVEARARAQAETKAHRAPTWADRHDYAPRHEVDGIRQEAR